MSQRSTQPVTPSSTKSQKQLPVHEPDDNNDEDADDTLEGDDGLTDDGDGGEARDSLDDSDEQRYPHAYVAWVFTFGVQHGSWQSQSG